MNKLIVTFIALAIAGCSSANTSATKRTPSSKDVYTCQAQLAGSKIHGSGDMGTVPGTVVFSQNPFSLVFTSNTGATSTLFDGQNYCGFGVSAGRCQGPLPGHVSGEHVTIDCDNSGKEYRKGGGRGEPGSHPHDALFDFDSDRGKFECWSFVASADERPQKTLLQFFNCQ